MLIPLKYLFDPVDDAYFTNDSIDSVDRSDSTNGFVPGSPSATRYEVKVLLRDQSEGTCVRSIGISKPPNSGSSWNKNSSLYTTGMNSNSGRNARTTPTDTDKSEDAITVVSGIGISSGFECIKVRAIIDTGADVSLIDESIVLQSKARILKLTSTSDIRQVEGKPLELLGKCVMALFLHGKMYQHTFLIPRTPSVIRQYQVLIGNDLLSKIGELSINYTKGLLILRDSKIASTFIFKLRGDSNRRVCIEEPNPTNWTYGQSATSSMSKPDDSSRHTKSSSFVLSQASEKSGTPSSAYLSSMSDVLSDTKGMSDSQISSPTKLSSDGNTSIVSGNVGRFSQNPSAARATSTPIRSTKLSFASSPRSVNTEPPSGSRRNFHTKTFPNGNSKHSVENAPAFTPRVIQRREAALTADRLAQSSHTNQKSFLNQTNGNSRQEAALATSGPISNRTRAKAHPTINTLSNCSSDPDGGDAEILEKENTNPRDDFVFDLDHYFDAIASENGFTQETVDDYIDSLAQAVATSLTTNQLEVAPQDSSVQTEDIESDSQVCMLRRIRDMMNGPEEPSSPAPSNYLVFCPNSRQRSDNTKSTNSVRANSSLNSQTNCHPTTSQSEGNNPTKTGASSSSLVDDYSEFTIVPKLKLKIPDLEQIAHFNEEGRPCPDPVIMNAKPAFPPLVLHSPEFDRCYFDNHCDTSDTSSTDTLILNSDNEPSHSVSNAPNVENRYVDVLSDSYEVQFYKRFALVPVLERAKIYKRNRSAPPRYRFKSNPTNVPSKTPCTVPLTNSSHGALSRCATVRRKLFQPTDSDEETHQNNTTEQSLVTPSNAKVQFHVGMLNSRPYVEPVRRFGIGRGTARLRLPSPNPLRGPGFVSSENCEANSRLNQTKTINSTPAVTTTCVSINPST